jgi:hypothetical protein
MPRFIYWTILIGNEPTAFRAREREDILPTLKQLQRKHPNAVLRWFERGRLWDSPEQARAELAEARRQRPVPRPSGWRPGGEHRDPRERFKAPREQKKRQILRRLRRKPRAGEVPGAAGTAPPTRPLGRERPGPPFRQGRFAPESSRWEPDKRRPTHGSSNMGRGPSEGSSRRPAPRPPRGPGGGSRRHPGPPGEGRGRGGRGGRR